MKLSYQELSAILKQQEAELAVINSVQEGLVAEMDMQGIYIWWETVFVKY